MSKNQLKLIRIQFLVLVAFCIVALQLSLTFSVSETKGISSFYEKLCNWDCGWYTTIAEDGYQSDIPPIPQSHSSNVGFFPGYPILARLIYLVTGIPAKTILPFISHIAAWGFWTYLLLFLRRNRTPLTSAFLVVFGLICHPNSSFMVYGYSESLFLLLLTAFLYHCTGKSRSNLFQSGISGYFMSATRLVGVPIGGFPVLHHFFSDRRRNWKELFPWSVVSLATITGALSFFIYCQVRFGAWNLYMMTEKIGWNVYADYFALFNPKSYLGTSEKAIAGGLSPLALDQLITPIFLALFFSLVVFEVALSRTFENTRWNERISYGLTAFLMFYIAVSGSFSKSFYSMTRYTLPIQLILSLYFLQMRTSVRFSKIMNWIGFGIFAGLFLFLFFRYSLVYTQLFMSGKWAG